MQALSTRNDDPAGASRPYDVARDGFVMGEGAGSGGARVRGARRGPRRTDLRRGVSGGPDAPTRYHIAAPDPDGAGQHGPCAPRSRTSDVAPSDVVHVNAHATSTPVGDVIEANAIRAVLGGDAIDVVAVSATKSMTGHLLGGAGALESVFTILALHDRQAPPTINVDRPRPAACGSTSSATSPAPLG